MLKLSLWLRWALCKSPRHKVSHTHTHTWNSGTTFKRRNATKPTYLQFSKKQKKIKRNQENNKKTTYCENESVKNFAYTKRREEREGGKMNPALWHAYKYSCILTATRTQTHTKYLTLFHCLQRKCLNSVRKRMSVWVCVCLCGLLSRRYTSERHKIQST